MKDFWSFVGALWVVIVGDPTIIPESGGELSVSYEKADLAIRKESGEIFKKVWKENSETLSLHSQI